MEYLVFGYQAGEGEEVIFEMGDLVGDAYEARYQEGFDLFGGYSLAKFDSLEEAIAAYPGREVDKGHNPGHGRVCGQARRHDNFGYSVVM